ncbi:hypothetical protein ILYODFUR_021588 [Ilyodon furcidens]|uniref:Uncharacterized protein n=1 Tax=Ilyodon furcidens TaxID=33524 RepID=A0ABV0SPW3_9TELE
MIKDCLVAKLRNHFHRFGRVCLGKGSNLCVQLNNVHHLSLADTEKKKYSPLLYSVVFCPASFPEMTLTFLKLRKQDCQQRTRCKIPKVTQARSADVTPGSNAQLCRMMVFMSHK